VSAAAHHWPVVVVRETWPVGCRCEGRFGWTGAMAATMGVADRLAFRVDRVVVVRPVWWWRAARIYILLLVVVVVAGRQDDRGCRLVS